MVRGRLEDDRVRLLANDIGDGVPVVRRVAELEEACHQAVDRPADVRGRRACLDEAVRRRPHHCLADERRVVAQRVSRQRQAESRRLARRRGAADHHVADGRRHVGCRRALHLNERVREPPLVDEEQPLAIHAEGRAEPGGTARRGVDPVADRRRVEDGARGLRRRALDGARRAGDGRGRSHELAREVTEEPAAPEVRAAGPPAFRVAGPSAAGVIRPTVVGIRSARILSLFAHPGASVNT